MFVPSVLQVRDYVGKLMNVCSVNNIHDLAFSFTHVDCWFVRHMMSVK